MFALLLGPAEASSACRLLFHWFSLISHMCGAPDIASHRDTAARAS